MKKLIFRISDLRVIVEGNTFEIKETLKEAGYRFDGENKYWRKPLTTDEKINFDEIEKNFKVFYYLGCREVSKNTFLAAISKADDLRRKVQECDLHIRTSGVYALVTPNKSNPVIEFNGTKIDLSKNSCYPIPINDLEAFAKHLTDLGYKVSVYLDAYDTRIFNF